MHTSGSKYNVCVNRAKTESVHGYSVSLLNNPGTKRGGLGPLCPFPKSATAKRQGIVRMKCLA